MYTTKKVLADCLGLTERRIAQLRQAGITHRNIYKGYELESSVRDYIRYKLNGRHKQSSIGGKHNGS